MKNLLNVKTVNQTKLHHTSSNIKISMKQFVLTMGIRQSINCSKISKKQTTGSSYSNFMSGEVTNNLTKASGIFSSHVQA